MNPLAVYDRHFFKFGFSMSEIGRLLQRISDKVDISIKRYLRLQKLIKQFKGAHVEGQKNGTRWRCWPVAIAAAERRRGRRLTFALSKRFNGDMIDTRTTISCTYFWAYR
ncbi:hypothetical protein B7W85_04360 [Allorhizobium ampelinum]|nr:hypothetical protein B7W85_04360 [Allorhizobium ampelinum]